MSIRRFIWSALLGLTVLSGRSAYASPNQDLANIVANSLRTSGVLRNYQVDVSVVGGVVELTGNVNDPAQRDEVLRLVQGVPAVERVINNLQVTSPAAGIVPVQGPALLPPRLPEPTPGPSVETGPRTLTDGNGRPAAGALIPDPVPMGRGAPPAYGEMNPPRMPPYAWPTYAPYNNFSRVAMPQALPYQAFPFIGPIYPFPKVPLGWRSVKLEWDDGYWWFGQVGNKYNWWKLRYH